MVDERLQEILGRFSSEIQGLRQAHDKLERSLSESSPAERPAPAAAELSLAETALGKLQEAMAHLDRKISKILRLEENAVRREMEYHRMKSELEVIKTDIMWLKRRLTEIESNSTGRTVSEESGAESASWRIALDHLAQAPPPPPAFGDSLADILGATSSPPAKISPAGAVLSLTSRTAVAPVPAAPPSFRTGTLSRWKYKLLLTLRDPRSLKVHWFLIGGLRSSPFWWAKYAVIRLLAKAVNNSESSNSETVTTGSQVSR